MSKKKPSAKQLAARAKFVAMVRAAAAKRKSSKGGRSGSSSAPKTGGRTVAKKSKKKGNPIVRYVNKSKGKKGKGPKHNPLSKYIPSGIAPLVGGAAVGFSVGQIAKTVLVSKSIEKTGKPGFVGSDFGSFVFDLGHVVAAHMLLPRKLGSLRKGYVVGAAAPQAFTTIGGYVQQAYDKIRGNTPAGAPSGSGASAARLVSDASGRQNVTVIGQPAAQPSTVQQIAAAVGQVLNAATRTSGVAGFESGQASYDDDDSGDANFAGIAEDLGVNDGDADGFAFAGRR